MQKIRDLILTLMAIWARVPEAVKKALRDMAAIAVAVVLAFQWSIPTTFSQAQQEALAAFFLVAAAVYAVARTELLPALLAWLLGISVEEAKAHDYSRAA